nr:reverse transcriptase domain-containing protein [Tanacetum cinerariifolium]
MQTRSSLRLVSDPSSNPTPSTNLNPKGRNRRCSKQRIEDFNLEEISPLIVTMADQRTMAQLLQAPTKGYEDAIVVRAITTDNFELKHELHKLDTFYNSLNSKYRYSRNKPVVAKKSTNTSTSDISPDVAELKDMVKALLLDKKGQNQSPTPVKAVEESCVTCGGAHSYRNCPATDGNVIVTTFKNLSLKPSQLTTTKLVENELEATKDTVNPTNNGSTKDVQPPAVQSKSPVLTSEPVNSLISETVIALVSALKPNPKTSIPYPSRRNDERNCKKANNQIEKFYQIFKDISFEITFADALILLPKFALTLKALIRNKENLSEMARTPLSEHCFAVLLKKLLEKLGDPGKFLIPCDFPCMAECLALADFGASINLMPFSVWKRLFLPDLIPTCMNLELANRSISHPVGVAEDVYVKVGSFHFSADFVVVDFDADPRVPLILGRSFLKTGRALIDVFEGELTFLVGKEAITFNLDQTSRYLANYSDMTAKRIDVIDMACEEYSQEVLEVDAFLAIEDEPTSLEFYQPYLDPEGDIILLEAFLNDDPLPSPSQGNYLLEVRKELKISKAKSDKSSVDEPPEVELRDLPPHLEYAFLEGDDKLPIIIAKDLSVEEKTALITVPKSHKRAIAWKLFDIKGINPKFCTHKILMEEDFELAVQHQRRVNPKIQDVIKQEVIKLLKDGLIYPISDSPWVSPVHCVPKKGGFFGYFQIPIDLKDQEKTTFTCPYETFAYRRMPFGLCNAPGTFQRKDSEELMCDASDYAIGAVLGQHQDKHFQPIHYASKAMTEAESNYTMTEKEMLAVVYAFEKFWRENLAADHLSRLENPHQNVLDPKEINESFLLETLNLVFTRGNQSTPWFADFTNYHVENFVIKGTFLSSRGNKYILVVVDYLSKWVEAKTLPTNDSRVVCKFPKNLFARFGTPRVIISDRGAHFCNDQFAKVMQKYGVTHRLATTYHPQTSGQVEVSNRGLKCNLERAVGENRAFWSDKLDDALWAFRTAYKTPIGCTPYKLVYKKACHFHVELEHKADLALKYANFDLKTAGDHRKVKINELNELCDQAYKKSLIYKEKTKRLHDSKIKNRVFNIGDRVLLFNSRLKIFFEKLKSRWSRPFTIS